MPDIPPSVIAGIPVVGDIAGAIMQGAQNRKSRKWQEKMYNKQRQDALADYTMQNEYNSPSATMARLKAAGLNPNLVYGNGATTLAAPVRSTDAGNPQFEASKIDLGGAVNTYLNAETQQLQNDNLKAINTNLIKEASLKDAQTLSTLASADLSRASTETSKFKLALDTQLLPYTLEGSRLQNEKVREDTRFTIDQNMRGMLLADATLSENAERILNLKAERANNVAERQRIYAAIAGIKKDNQLKQFDIQLRKEGVSPNDPAYIRILIQQLAKYGISTKP